MELPAYAFIICKFGNYFIRHHMWFKRTEAYTFYIVQSVKAAHGIAYIRTAA